MDEKCLKWHWKGFLFWATANVKCISTQPPRLYSAAVCLPLFGPRNHFTILITRNLKPTWVKFYSAAHWAHHQCICWCIFELPPSQPTKFHFNSKSNISRPMSMAATATHIYTHTHTSDAAFPKINSLATGLLARLSVHHSPVQSIQMKFTSRLRM